MERKRLREMKKARYSPEIRQAALRLLEMWRIVSSFSTHYAEMIIEAETDMIFCDSSLTNVSTPFSITDRMTEYYCRMETLHEKKYIADKIDELMRKAWRELTKRDKYVLTAYKREVAQGEKLQRISSHYSVSKSRAYQYRDSALKRLWNQFPAATGKSHQYIFDLIFQWGMYVCVKQGRASRKLIEPEINRLQSELKKTGLLLDDREKLSQAEFPCISIEPSWMLSGNRKNPDSVRVKLLSRRRDCILEKRVEDILVKSGYIFQIYRLRGQGKNPLYQAVYEFPIEQIESSFRPVASNYGRNEMLYRTRYSAIQSLEASA